MEATLLRSLHDVLAHQPTVRLALVFGSHARGTATTASDLDIALAGNQLDLLSLGAELSLATEMETDVVDLIDPGVSLLDAIVHEGVVVYEAHPGAAARWRSHALASLETDRPWFARMRNAYLQKLTREVSAW